MKYNLVTISSDYCNYLRKFDNKVSYNFANKESRPFVGVLFEINKLKYFAPLSSPKPKHVTMKNQIDFYKINNGKLGVINFNNMIPVIEGCYNIIDLSKSKSSILKRDKVYYILLDKQLRWLIRNGNNINKKAKLLYDKKLSDTLNSSISSRCCNFKLLEIKCNEYMINI